MRARGVQSFHSPFMFDFWNTVLKGDYKNLLWEEIEQERQRFLSDQKVIEVSDLGAGSKVMKGNKRRVSQIAKFQLQAKKDAEFLAKFIRKYQCKNVLELGSSLGISGAYLASEADEVVTVEGCPNILMEAKKSWKHLGLQNIQAVQGNIDEELEAVLKSRSFDLCVIDANHSYKACRRYWEKIEVHISSKGAIVFDDIYWDRGMTQAWNEILRESKAQLKLDFFHFGILIFNSDLSPQHYTVKYA